MSTQIKDYISKYDICCTHQSAQTSEILISHHVPDRPWAKVGTDLFECNDRDYLVTVDSNSSFFEIDRLHSKTAAAIIPKLKQQFARHGIPDMVVSDNGPPYNSHEFKEFAAKYDFYHITSSPGYAPSNRKAESAVKIAKKLMIKAKEAGTDQYLALLDYHNIPTEGMNSSPALRLLGRRTKTTLPTAKELLMPKTITNTLKKLGEKRMKQATYYNRNAKDILKKRRRSVYQTCEIQQELEDSNRKTTSERKIVRSRDRLRIGLQTKRHALPVRQVLRQLDGPSQ